MSESTLLDLKNKFFGFCQDKLSFLCEKSFILHNIDNIIFFFIAMTLICSTFFASEHIGILAIIVAALTVIKLFVKKGTQIQILKADGMLILYFLICIMSVINSTLVPQSIHGFLKTLIYLAFYFSAANYLQNNHSKIKYLFCIIGILCFTESIIAIIQNISGIEQISTWQDSHYLNPEDTISRAYGTLKPFNPNLLGGYLIACMPCLLGLGLIAISQKHFKSFYYDFGMFLVCALAVFLTGSRGAYLALGAMIAGLLAITGRVIFTDYNTVEKVKKYWKIVTGSLIGAVVAVLIAVPPIAKRILSIFLLRGDSSTSFRMNVYSSSLAMLKDNWILGIGTGNQTFREIYGLYMMTGFDALSTYSVPLEIAVESGVFALFSFIAYLGYIIVGAVKYISSPNDLNRKIILSCVILTILGVMTHGLFDTIYFRPQVQFVFWTMMAVASAILIKPEDCEKEE